MGSEEIASSLKLESDREHGRVADGRNQMEPNDEGVLELGVRLEDETSSMNRLSHWKMEGCSLTVPLPTQRCNHHHVNLSMW